MDWLELNDIKDQLRIERDYHDEDTILTRYGNSAEATILNLTGRTYEELKAMNPTGENAIPADIWEATVMLVVSSYEHRSPSAQYQMYAVGYGFDMKIKPYMRLAGKEASV